MKTGPANKFIFSVIIPTRDRPAQLSRCLAAFCRLKFPRRAFEVVVVDDGSRFSPAPVVTAFNDRLHLTLIRQAHSGPARARNTGARRSRGVFLTFCDDDCLPHREWLEKFYEHLRSTNCAAAGGAVTNGCPANPFSRVSHAILAHLLYRQREDCKNPHFIGTGNMMIRRDLFKSLGGFDPRFSRAGGEDRDMVLRLKAGGCRIDFLADAVVRHCRELCLRTFCRQHFDYGRGARLLCCGRSRDASPFRGSGAAWRMPLCLLRAIYHQSRRRQAPVAVALFLLSQLATLAGFLYEAAVLSHRPARRPLARMPCSRL